MDSHSGEAPPAAGGGEPGAAVLANRVEALKILTLALLRELAALAPDREESERMGLQEQTRHFEIELIRCALIRTGGRQRRAAKLLGVSVATLNHKIKRYGILSDVVFRGLGARRPTRADAPERRLGPMSS